jgi:hypothetical protein
MMAPLFEETNLLLYISRMEVFDEVGELGGPVAIEPIDDNDEMPGSLESLCFCGSGKSLAACPQTPEHIRRRCFQRP